MNHDIYEAWIDVGGTFTDCFVRRPDGHLLRSKTLSSGRVPIAATSFPDLHSLCSPQLQDDCSGFWTGARLQAFDARSREVWSAPVVEFAAGKLRTDPPLPRQSDFRFELDPLREAPALAVHRLLQIPLLSQLPSLRVRLGTTKGTNALLTRRGAKTVLAVTAPFVDLLAIGDQTRANLFALAIDRPPPLAERTLAIRERLNAQGEVLQPLDLDDARDQLATALADGYQSLAICLMHSYCNPAHEDALATIARQVGFRQVSVSSRLASVIEFVARAQTTVVDAYLSPIIRDYLQQLQLEFGEQSQTSLSVMTSSGGLVDWSVYHGKDSILSGPAGGVIALHRIAHSTGRPALIGLDMGGTSTDVCRVAEELPLQYESTKAGVRILTPTLPIETVAAGGGSICWCDGVSLRVGPQSAGASPGPAGYGRGGPLTITDLNLFLGRIPPSQFPFPLDQAAIVNELERVLHALPPTSSITTIDELAAGFRSLANEQMADAVRTVSIAQGVDPRQHTLLGFGGAAGQHICDIAAILGITEIMDFADGGLLSALGMGLASRKLDGVVPVYCSLPSCDWNALEEQLVALEQHQSQQLQQQASGAAVPGNHRSIELRYQGTDATLTIAWCAPHHITAAFAAAHQQRFGYTRPGQPLEVVAIRLECELAAQHALPTARRVAATATPVPLDPQIDGPPLYAREHLLPGQSLTGPALVLNQGSTLVIEAGWRAEVLSEGTLHLVHAQPARPAESTTLATVGQSEDAEMDLVFRDCFGQRLAAIATQMGLILQQTAVSVNVKQRRDFSCALFDASGRLLANAPHVPVHLGAMGQTVRAILATFGDMQAGDEFVTNDPYCGGSHLPDVTVVTPVFADHATRPQMFVANRAHHADIGGLTPGSMSISAKCLADEGVVISPRRLRAAGRDLSHELREFLQASPLPPRNVAENLADLAAQQAANARGVQLLQEYAAQVSWAQIRTYAAHLLDAAEARTLHFLNTHFTDAREFENYLDDGTPLRVRISRGSDQRLSIDFSGSGSVHPGNFNANPSIVSAAVMYVLRCLIADSLPLNEGVLRCVDVVLPHGILNPQPHADSALSPAVAAGNVETSQRVVDVLLGALGAAAASQGTMNNLLFGNRQFGFYETICGGAGATAGHDGASGVHTHMTNTRLTDPEVLELRYPIRLVHFGLRPDSGGRGRWRGGDGVVRRMEFLEPVDVSLLTSRRGPYAPFGLEGGQAGQIGHNTLIRADGTRVHLPGCAQLQVQPGDQLELKTPGGGGFGQ